MELWEIEEKFGLSVEGIVNTIQEILESDDIKPMRLEMMKRQG